MRVTMTRQGARARFRRVLRGTYQIVAARSPVSGKSYQGTVSITPTGDTYQLQWKLPRESYGGVGIRRGNKLVVGWGARQGSGVVAYTRHGPDLDGVWSTAGGNKLGTEVLRPRHGTFP